MEIAFQVILLAIVAISGMSALVDKDRTGSLWTLGVSGGLFIFAYFFGDKVACFVSFFFRKSKYIFGASSDAKPTTFTGIFSNNYISQNSLLLYK